MHRQQALKGGFSMQLKPDSVCLVTGASSGIGRAIAEALVRRGMRVYGTSRHPAVAEDNGIRMLPLDLCDEASIAAAVAALMEREGRIDLLVNNAGAGIGGAVEDASPEALRQQLDVAFLGHVLMTRAVLPHMRRNGGGRILLTGSVAAGIPIPFQAMYSAAKAALRAFASALAGEVAPFGIDVTVIEPGDTCTGFTDRRMTEIPSGSAYTGRAGRSIAVMERDERGGASPDAIARVAVRAAFARHPKPRITVGFRYRLFDVLRRCLPERLTQRIIAWLYA